MSSNLLVAGSDEVEVTYSDQQNINTYGRLSQNLHMEESRLKAAIKSKENISDAQSEVMMADSGFRLLSFLSFSLFFSPFSFVCRKIQKISNKNPTDSGCKYRIGECYIDMNEEDATALLEKAENDINDVIADVTKKIEDIKATLAKLKVELYGKFGRNAINLEED